MRRLIIGRTKSFQKRTINCRLSS